MLVAKCNKHRLRVSATRAEDKVIAEVVTRMSVRMHDVEDPVRTLSGGNHQKVAIGKWPHLQPAGDHVGRTNSRSRRCRQG
jgi:ABC-type sugar transport system ATPase subunit